MDKIRVLQDYSTNIYQPNWVALQNYIEILKNPDEALPVIELFLNNAHTEKQVLEALYVVDRMAEEKIEGVDKLYPTLSKFNRTTSPNIQVMLSGIYRKTLVPDAYGPLHRMLYQQIVYPNSPYFDPTEEIGGAILDYLA